MKLLIKYSFYQSIQKNFFKYLLLFFTTISVCAFFIPILQVEYNIFQEQQNISQKSQVFDEFYVLPNQQALKNSYDNKTLSDNAYNKQRDGDFISSKIYQKLLAPLKEKYQFKEFLVSRHFTYIPDGKKIIFLETGYDLRKNNQEILKVDLKEGLHPVLNSNEIVLNTKFVSKLVNDKNQPFEIGNSLKLFETNFKVVGTGESINNLSFTFNDTFRLKNELCYKGSELYNEASDSCDKDVNLYHFAGTAFIDRQIFENLFKNKAFDNFDNKFYVKFKNGQNETARAAIFKTLSENLNFHPKVISFKADSGSGLKSNFSYLEFLFLIVSFVLIIIFMISILIYLLNDNFNHSKNLTWYLKILGFSRHKLATMYFQINFLFFLFASLVGYFLGFILNNYFIQTNNQLFFIILKYNPFNPLFFLGTLGFFSLLFGGISYLVTAIKIYYFNDPQRNQYFFKIHYFNRVRVFLLEHLRFKLFIFLWFRDFWKKIITLFWITIIFTLSFLLIFIKVASDNFLYNQLTFLKTDSQAVKSFTKFKNQTIFIDPKTSKINNNVAFVTEAEIANSLVEKPKLINDLNVQAFKDEKIFSCIKLESTKINAECLLKPRKINKDTLNNLELKQRMEKYNIDSIYFNIAPYHKDKELPLLVLDLKAATLNDEVISKPLNVPGYFLPPRWEDFFNIKNLSEKLSDFEFQEDSSLGITQGENVDDWTANAIVSENLKLNNYKLGDSFEFYYGNEGIFSKKKLKIKIVGFIKSEFALNNYFFIDYDLLTKKEIYYSSDPKGLPYNFLLSKTEKKGLRNLVMNVSNIEFDLDDINAEKLKKQLLPRATNFESLTIEEFNNLTGYHFKLFQTYFFITLIFGVINGFFFLILLVVFFLEKQSKNLKHLFFYGHRFKHLLWDFMFGFLITLIIGLLAAFIMSYSLFNTFSGNFQANNILFNVKDIWNYLWYLFLIFIFCIICALIYHIFYLQKIKKSLTN